jgi:hypothetical protein
MNFDAALVRIHEHLENDRVENAVMACLRVARAAEDHFNAAIFLRELYPNKTEVVRTLYEDTQHLNKEARKFLFEKSLERWLEVHTIEGIDTDEDKDEGERRNVLPVAVGEIESEILRWQAAIGDLRYLPGWVNSTPPHSLTALSVKNRVSACASPAFKPSKPGSKRVALTTPSPFSASSMFKASSKVF